MGFSDFIKDLKDSAVDRMRNPFVLTFIIAWIAHNWLLVYELLYFNESSVTLGSRITVIADYVKLHKFNNLSIKPLCWSVAAIITYLFFSNVGLFFFSASDRYVKPLIYWITNRARLVTREIYNDLLQRNDKLLKQKDELSLKENKLRRDFEEIEKERGTLRDTISQAADQNRTLAVRVDGLEKEKLQWQQVTFSTDHGINSLNNIFAGLVWKYFVIDNINAKPVLKHLITYNNGIIYVNEKPTYDLIDTKINDLMTYVSFTRVNHENKNIIQRTRLLKVNSGLYRGTEFKLNNNFEEIEREIIFSSSDLKLEELALMSSFSAIESEGLKIITAKYGINDKFVDIADLLNGKIVDDSISIVINNELAGDPVPGPGKELKATYSLSGTIKNITIKEGERLTLPIYDEDTGVLTEAEREERKRKIGGLLNIMKTNHIYPKYTRQWIYRETCLVHDYLLKGVYKIAVDTYIFKNRWEIQIFGRDESSDSFLSKEVLKNAEFISGDLTKKGNRFIYKTLNTQASLDEVAQSLHRLLAGIDSYKTRNNF